MTSGSPKAHARTYRRRELGLPDGSRLVLKADGSIDQVDAEKVTKESWAPGDPDWARHAIRFGLLPQASTALPRGRDVEASKPPRR